MLLRSGAVLDDFACGCVTLRCPLLCTERMNTCMMQCVAVCMFFCVCGDEAFDVVCCAFFAVFCVFLSFAVIVAVRVYAH